jgi:hypothetical protein
MAKKITLRKANTLQNALNDLLKNIEVKARIDINEFVDVESTIASSNVQFFADDARRNDILMSVYSIRGLVGVTNATAGITTRLTHAAYVDRRVKHLEEILSNTNKLENLDVIKGKVEKIKARPADSRASIYGRDDEVGTGVLTDAQMTTIRGVMQDLKKQKQTINDEVLELNVRTEIELPDDVEAVLTREGLL